MFQTPSSKCNLSNLTPIILHSQTTPLSWNAADKYDWSHFLPDLRPGSKPRRSTTIRSAPNSSAERQLAPLCTGLSNDLPERLKRSTYKPQHLSWTIPLCPEGIMLRRTDNFVIQDRPAQNSISDAGTPPAP